MILKSLMGALALSLAGTLVTAEPRMSQVNDAIIQLGDNTSWQGYGTLSVVLRSDSEQVCMVVQGRGLGISCLDFANISTAAHDNIVDHLFDGNALQGASMFYEVKPQKVLDGLGTASTLYHVDTDIVCEGIRAPGYGGLALTCQYFDSLPSTERAAILEQLEARGVDRLGD